MMIKQRKDIKSDLYSWLTTCQISMVDEKIYARYDHDRVHGHFLLHLHSHHYACLKLI